MPLTFVKGADFFVCGQFFRFAAAHFLGTANPKKSIKLVCPRLGHDVGSGTKILVGKVTLVAILGGGTKMAAGAIVWNCKRNKKVCLTA